MLEKNDDADDNLNVDRTTWVADPRWEYKHTDRSAKEFVVEDTVSAKPAPPHPVKWTTTVSLKSIFDSVLM